MTGLQVRDVFPPDQALLFVQEVRERRQVVALDETEYLETIARPAERGFKSGRIYDALPVRCARKANAQSIHTWNLRHFQASDPEMADPMRTP